MLSLGRRLGEYVMIGDQIKVTVIEKDGYLRLAIDAPKEIPIIRGEVLEGQEQEADHQHKKGKITGQRKKQTAPKEIRKHS